ncbi:MAG: type II secretion system F family protein [Bryobacteraceae bacterium]|jgi:tight adherence protein B
MALFITFAIVTWLLALGVWATWRRSRRKSDLARIETRLAGGRPVGKPGLRPAAALIQPEDRTAAQIVLRVLSRIRLNQRSKQFLEQSGLKWNHARVIQFSLALCLAGFAAVWFLAPPYRKLAPVAGLGLGSLPLLYVRRQRRRRMLRFEEQFPEALEFLARAMRAGHAFSVSLEMIHAEFQDPIAEEFKHAFDEQNLGMPLETALEKMAQRVPLIDVQFFISAVTLQKRTGGNLAEVLEKLASLIRERFKLRGRIRAISAHGRMTGGALSSIPVGVALMMFWVNPDYVRFFVQDETGKTMLGVAIGLQVLGYFIMKRIVKIEV